MKKIFTLRVCVASSANSTHGPLIFTRDMRANMSKDAKGWGCAFEELFMKKHSLRDKNVRLILDADEENSKTYICELWNGIFLWGNEFHSEYFDYPGFGLTPQKNYVVLNICLAGRCEISLVDAAYVYMEPGLFNANNRRPRGGYSFPGGFYEGVEMAFDFDILEKTIPPELSSFGLSPEYLAKLLEKGNGNYMAAVTDEGMRESRFLYESLRSGTLGLADYRFFTVSLLYRLKNGYASEVQGKTLVTKGQRRIAFEAERMLTEDFRRHFTVEELAARYGVSPSALKKYFEAVFGQPISRYLREKRMEKAKKLLVESDRKVGEIASVCGYENQGKFGAAFKSYAGTSPLEYRLLHK